MGRKYPEIKLQENIDSEIMEVLLQEARESYDEEIVVELQSNSSEEMDSNVDRIEGWLVQWKKENQTVGYFCLACALSLLTYPHVR